MSDPKKPRMSLIPYEALELVARAFESGLKGGKQPHDWKQKDPQLFVDALLRHAGRVDADKPDPDSGLPHAALAACNALIILWHAAHSTEGTPVVFEALDSKEDQRSKHGLPAKPTPIPMPPVKPPKKTNVEKPVCHICKLSYGYGTPGAQGGAS